MQLCMYIYGPIYKYVCVYSVVAMFGGREEQNEGRKSCKAELAGEGRGHLLCAFFFWGASLREDSRATLIYTLWPL